MRLALALCALLAGCTALDGEARCREAQAIYDGIEHPTAADVGLTLVACVR